MRSATVIASSWSWVTMMKVMPSRRCSSISSSCVLSRSFLSSAASGSSSSSICGRRASERASATRCFWPPESWSGLRFSRPSSLTRATISATRVIDVGGGHAGALQPEGDIVAHRQMRKQRVVLEHHVDRPLMRQHMRDVAAVEQDAALVRRLEAGQHPQQRGLAAARSARAARKIRRPGYRATAGPPRENRRISSPPPRCAAAACRRPPAASPDLAGSATATVGSVVVGLSSVTALVASSSVMIPRLPAPHASGGTAKAQPVHGARHDKLWPHRIWFEWPARSQ